MAGLDRKEVNPVNLSLLLEVACLIFDSRARERYADLTPEDFERRRTRGWELVCHQVVWGKLYNVNELRNPVIRHHHQVFRLQRTLHQGPLPFPCTYRQPISASTVTKLHLWLA